METDFKGYKIENVVCEFNHVPAVSDIYSCKFPVNEIQYDCQKTDPLRIESGNFFAVRFRFTSTIYIKDIETLTDKINKVELKGDCTFIVATKDGVLFSNTMSPDLHHCLALLIRSTFSEMNKYAKTKNVDRMFPAPDDKQIIALSKTLDMSRGD